MSSISLSLDVESVLRHLRETTELRDSRGQVLGVFVPQAERACALFDLDEAERILAAEWDQGRPLKDFWNDLHAQKGSA